jgi:hypothetical protein
LKEVKVRTSFLVLKEKTRQNKIMEFSDDTNKSHGCKVSLSQSIFYVLKEKRREKNVVHR